MTVRASLPDEPEGSCLWACRIARGSNFHTVRVVAPIELSGRRDLAVVVVLERATLPEDGVATPETSAAEAVAGFLQPDAVVIRVPVGWDDADERLDLAVNGRALPDALFVQVLSRGTAQRSLATPKLLKFRLSRRVPQEVLDRSRLVHWFPGKRTEIS